MEKASLAFSSQILLLTFQPNNFRFDLIAFVAGSVFYFDIVEKFIKLHGVRNVVTSKFNIIWLGDEYAADRREFYRYFS